MIHTRRFRLAVFAVLVALTIAAGCSDDSDSSSTKSSNSSSDRRDDRGSSSSSSSQNLDVDTPNGSVSLSLDGALPPSWPTDFPTPSGATPAGSGSLQNASTDTQVAVYDYSGTPSDAYDFYKDNASLTVSDAKAIGGSSNYAGTMKLSGSFNGSVSVVAIGGSTRIVAVLEGAAASSASSSSSSASS